ncbi:MAG TPA: BTAD domain-containing putative transcriptional regulator [Jiangellales bacterium]|nr:BTAD domain-containing putative transcriptional regulator [Jiangellales bacterium]
MGADVRVQVLGPLVATVGGREVSLGPRRQRAVLGVLLAARGRVVPVDRLVEDTWAGSPPAAALASLHAYVSVLRRMLEPERGSRAPARLLVRPDPGYVLRLEPEQVDAEVFSRLAAEGARLLAAGHPAEALRALDEGLGLWRGPAYADLPETDTIRAESQRLDNLRTQAVEDRLSALVELGEHVRAVPELEALIDEAPLRERPRELLALALYRSGRQAEALGSLRDARATLVDELGIDPGPGLRSLEQRILTQDPALDASPPGSSGPDGLPGPEGPAAAAGATSGADAGPVGVAAAGLPRQRRPAQAEATRNLPAALTTFVGRTDEQATVSGLLAGTRLVTLVGPGGIGKTRLALEVAGARPDGDGPWLVELAGVGDARLVVDAVTRALGLGEAPDLDALAALLAPRRLLVVLDNCEHVVEVAADVVGTLLSRCPDLQVLATSREALGVPGEVVHEVRPLRPGDESVELFLSRLRAVLPGFEPTAEQRLLVVGLCAWLEGVPLAIELAAAQCRLLSLDQVAAMLDDRFALLGEGPRTAATRHRTLEAAVAWSYDLLDEADRRRFCELAAFHGPFDLAAAQGLTADRAALRTVRRLVSTSLLRVDTASEPRRYRMLETMRDFAATRLDDQERRALADRHLAWVRTEVEAATPDVRSGQARQIMDRLDAMHADWRAALSHAQATGDGASMLALCGGLWWYWYRRGHISEGLRWLATALEVGTDESPLSRAQALAGTCALRYLSGDLAGAGAAAEQARQQATISGDPVVSGFLDAWSAYFVAATGDPVTAEAMARAGVEAGRRTGKPWLVTDALMILGQVLRSQGRADEAIATLEEAVRVGTSCGHAWSAGSAAWIRLKVIMDGGDGPAALAAAVPLVQQVSIEGDVTSWLVGVHSLAGALALAGRAEEGAVLLGAVESIGERIGFSPERMDPYDGPGTTALVKEALEPETFAAAHERGYGLTREEVMAVVDGLLSPLQTATSRS